MTNYSVNDGFGNEIAAGLESYCKALDVAQRYLADHPEDNIVIYSTEDDETIVIYSTEGEQSGYH